MEVVMFAFWEAPSLPSFFCLLHMGTVNTQIYVYATALSLYHLALSGEPSVWSQPRSPAWWSPTMRERTAAAAAAEAQALVHPPVVRRPVQVRAQRRGDADVVAGGDAPEPAEVRDVVVVARKGVHGLTRSRATAARKTDLSLYPLDQSHTCRVD